MLNGFIIVDKEAGKSSARVVARVKYLLKQVDKDAKVGHLGTLDPDGEGVLPMAIGRATRLFDYLTVKTKVYYTEFKFGVLTDTLDTAGTVIATSEKLPTIDEVSTAVQSFVGRYMQLPPQYSAKSYGGVKAYALARKGVDVPLEAAEIEIYSVTDVKQLSQDCFSMTVSCSGGTYIRSLARDVAEKLGTVGVMRYIKRLQSGCFTIKDAKKIDDITDITQLLLPLEYPLADYPSISLTEQDEKDLLDGKILTTGNNDGIYKAYKADALVGLARVEAGVLKMKTWLK